MQMRTVLFCALLGAPAFAQVDFTGQWESLYREDAPERLPGPELGGYLGMPLNEAGLRADWLATLNNGGAPGALPPGNSGRSLEVLTTHLLPGYLRKNGVPYSADAHVNEYYDYHKEPYGAEWITITTVVEDPTYLNTNWVTSTDFRKQPDAANWNPTACTAR